RAAAVGVALAGVEARGARPDPFRLLDRILLQPATDVVGVVGARALPPAIAAPMEVVDMRLLAPGVHQTGLGRLTQVRARDRSGRVAEHVRAVALRLVE